MQSECPNGKCSPKKKKDRQHVRLAEDSEELGASDSEDGFHASILTFKSKSQDLKISIPAVKVPVRIEDVDFQMVVDTGAAASIVSYTALRAIFQIPSTEASQEVISCLDRYAAGYGRADLG